MKIKFVKSQGIGNDFIIIEDLKSKLNLTEETRARLCNRHFGIGADGLIIVRPSQIADFLMIFYNPDGSQAEMCGNGIRCFGKYLYDYCLTNKTNLHIETLAGIKEVSLLISKEKAVGAIVDMGKPLFKPFEIPAIFEGDKIVNELLEIEKERIRITCVNMGNPHSVIFVEEADGVPIKTLGPLIEHWPIFPEKTNVELVQLINPEEIKMRVWERGAGETLACGTGACAAVVAGVKNRLTDRIVKVHLPGGDLDINWRKDGRVLMSGPAKEVFKGEFDLTDFI